MTFIPFELLDTGEEVLINTKYILYVLQLNTIHSQITMSDGTTINLEESVDDVDVEFNI